MSEIHDTSAGEDGRVKQGDEPPMETEQQKQRVVEMAFDYRGDVTVYQKDGRAVEGYIYDRRADGARACVKVLSGKGERVTIAWGDVARIVFSGRDTAAGKSWETWVKKYQEKKAKGEAANIEAELLE